MPPRTEAIFEHVFDDGADRTRGVAPRCLGSMAPCLRCGDVHARVSGSVSWHIDLLTGVGAWAIWHCCID